MNEKVLEVVSEDTDFFSSARGDGGRTKASLDAESAPARLEE